ncbi:MAG: hypothetical protein IPO90_17460 [Flavobacteriales bacterium]|nr:hypothetical protein [Flavobacteriales bacterium]
MSIPLLRYGFFAVSLCLSLCTSAQRPELDSQAAVQDFVHTAIATDQASGKLMELAANIAAHGSLTVVFTIGQKGEVETVFVEEYTIAEIPVRNQLKDYLKSMRFAFKLPKGKHFTFTEIITLN